MKRMSRIWASGLLCILSLLSTAAFAVTMTVPSTLQAIQFENKGTATVVNNNLALYTNTTVSNPVTFQANTTYKFDIDAFGTAAQSAYPIMHVLIDGIAIKSLTINSPTAKVFSFTYAVKVGGVRHLQLRFTNDLKTATEDRDLHIRSLGVSFVTPPVAGGIPKAPIQCAVPGQDAVNKSAWPEIFIGTAAQNCSDAAGSGTRAKPYCNPHLAMAQGTSAGRIFTFLNGEYRLMNFNNTSGQRSALALPSVSSSASQFVVVRADAGAKPIILGSSRPPKAWQVYSTNPRIFRLDVSQYDKDIYGLWQVIDGVSQTYTNAKRMRHVMVIPASGIRSHADVAALSDSSSLGTPEASMTEDQSSKNFTWTKANAGGTACGSSNNGCYIYLRADGSYSPNSYDFEIPQRPTFIGGSSYMVLDGLHGRFSVSDEVHFESKNNVLIKNSSFGHLAAANGNSYAIGLWYTNGSILKNNKFFDSAYWGGAPNSKGVTFMVSGNVAPNWVCNNEIYHIPGEAGIASKGGASNLKIVGNYVHDSGTCIQTDQNRTQDGVFYPAGNWTAQQNILERCDTGIHIGRGDSGAPSTPEYVINNVFKDNFRGILFGPNATPNSRIHNNIFIGGAKSNSCTTYGICGAGIYFSNNAAEVRDFSYILGNLNIKMSNNFFSSINYSHGVNRNWTANFANYNLAQFKGAYSAFAPEGGSLSGDPMLDVDYRPLTASPVIGAGLVEFYALPYVNMGIFLQ